MRWWLLLSVMCVVGCTSDPIFGPIETNMSNPLSVAVNSTTQRAYVVNANTKYLYTTGSLHVVNLATITAPARVNLTTLDSFGGQIAVDTTNSVAYVANRQSDDGLDTTDSVLSIDIAEANATFLSVSANSVARDPFGVGTDTTNSQIVVPTRDGTLEIFSIASSTPSKVVAVDLKRSLSDGSTLTTVRAQEVVVLGAQAFVTRDSGGMLVVNMSEVSTSGANPVDYFITDIPSPRGIATDGTSIFVVDVDGASNLLRQLAVTALTADTSNSTTTTKDKDDDSLLTTSFTVGNNPKEVVMNGTTAYVSNFDDDTISVVDTAANTVTAVTVGDEPFGLALYQETVGTNSHLLVCNHGSHTVSIINLASNTVVATYP
jgi:YVTN family beta-propeller protein